MKYIKLYEFFDKNYMLDNERISLSEVYKKSPQNIPDLTKFYNYISENNLGIDEGIDSLPTIKLNLDELTPTKQVLNVNNIKNKIGGAPQNENDLPFIFKNNDIFYIIDGHHRITLAILENKKTILVKIFID